MGKKKGAAKSGTANNASDPRLAGLSSVISKEAKRKEKKERKEKQTLLPLKRVNSGPVIYQTVPMSKYLYSDSRSVDFGFVGIVDIPNQAVYMDEVPAKPLDTSPLKVPNLDSKPYVSSSTIDAADMKALTAVKSHDMAHFLKKRVGEDNLNKIYETTKSPYEDLRETGHKSRGCCACFLLISFLLLIISAGTLVGLAFAGIQIPFLSDLLSPLMVTNGTDNGTVVGPYAVAGPGFDSGVYHFLCCELSYVQATMTKMYGEELDVSFEYVWPPETEKDLKIMKLFREVYEYFGFKIVHISVSDIKPLKSKAWRLTVRPLARAKYNQDLMMWYGFNEDARNGNVRTSFWKKLDGHFKEAFLSEFNTTMTSYTTIGGESFMNEAKRYYGKLKARRPPAHIPDEWGNCTIACP